MLWMGRWIHHYVSSTILVCLKSKELAESLDHSWNTNDVKVYWLGSLTHMEGFPHYPLQHIYMVFENIRCYGWADGSTIMPDWLVVVFSI
jgi:hypothetical protein